MFKNINTSTQLSPNSCDNILVINFAYDKFAIDFNIIDFLTSRNFNLVFIRSAVFKKTFLYSIKKKNFAKSFKIAPSELIIPLFPSFAIIVKNFSFAALS